MSAAASIFFVKALPKTFGLTELNFPHWKLRSRSYENKRERIILRWHQELTNAEYVFNFEIEIEDYSSSDVDDSEAVLAYSWNSWWKKSTTSIHSNNGCVTFASVWKRVFRLEFPEDNTIGLIPAQGYQPTRKWNTLSNVQYNALTWSFVLGIIYRLPRTTKVNQFKENRWHW